MPDEQSLVREILRTRDALVRPQASTLNPDNLRNNMRRTMTNALNDALGELPGRWPAGRKRFLLLHHRKQVAQALTDAVWPLVMDAALGIAERCIDDPGARRGVVSMGVPPPHADQGPPRTGPPVDFEG